MREFLMSGALTCRLPPHTSAYVHIRQHTSAYVSIRQQRTCRMRGSWVSPKSERQASARMPSCPASIRQHPFSSIRAAYVSIRQHTSAYVSIRRHTSAYVGIRRHTCPASSCPPRSRPDSMRMPSRSWSACQTRRQLELGATTSQCRFPHEQPSAAACATSAVSGLPEAIKRPARPVSGGAEHTSVYVSIRQDTSAYVRIRQDTCLRRSRGPRGR